MLLIAVMTEGAAPAPDSDTFQRLFHDFYGAVVRFFARQGCKPEECQDLAQDTFLRAYRSFDGFRGDAKASTWLITIATNVWRNRLRATEAAKRKADVIPLPEEHPIGVGSGARPGPALPAPDRPPSEETIDAERRRLLRCAIDGLPAEMRRSVLLRVYQEMSYRDIADVLSVSIETVKSQVSRARPRLKSALAEHYPDLDSRFDEGRMVT